ncbi:hypothetical protein LguiB_027199 [Lonicera macranthoides]
MRSLIFPKDFTLIVLILLNTFNFDPIFHFEQSYFFFSIYSFLSLCLLVNGFV